MTPTAVIGGGEFASALAALAAANGPVLRRTSPPGAAPAAGEPELAELARARLVLFVLPSSQVRRAAQVLGDYLDGARLLVHATRGLEPETFRRFSEVLREETPCLRVGALAGPTLATEVARGQPTAAVVGSRYPEVIDAVRAALGGPTFRVYGSDDLAGVELAAALSSVVALAAGLAAGLGLEYNTRAAVVVRGFAEMARLGVTLGADAATFTGLAGLGDLLASAQSDASADFRLGRAIGAGTPASEALAAMEASGAHAEGIRTVEAVQRMARGRTRVSLTDAIAAVLAGGEARAVVRGLMTLAPMSEGE